MFSFAFLFTMLLSLLIYFSSDKNLICNWFVASLKFPSLNMMLFYFFPVLLPSHGILTSLSHQVVAPLMLSWPDYLIFNNF